MCRQMLLKQRKAGPLASRPECCQALRDSFEREARFFFATSALETLSVAGHEETKLRWEHDCWKQDVEVSGNS